MQFCGATTDAAVAPRFSVVIPALNEATTIGACLQALAGQTYPHPVQVIVVDNGSTDDTVAVARSHGAQTVSEQQRGVCAARQRGLLAATGEIVVSTDADTTTPSHWLDTIDRSFAADDRVVGVAGRCEYLDGPRWARHYARLLFGLVGLVFRLTGRVGYATATNLAFRRSAFDGYDTRLTQGGDELDVLRRLRKRGRIVFVADHPTRTDARRLAHGFVYSVVVSFAFYYVLGYWLNRLAGRTVLGTAPAFRPGARTGVRIPRPVRIAGLLAVVAVLVGFGVYEVVA